MGVSSAIPIFASSHDLDPARLNAVRGEGHPLSISKLTDEAADNRTRRYMAPTGPAILAFQNGATVGDAFGLLRL